MLSDLNSDMQAGKAASFFGGIYRGCKDHKDVAWYDNNSWPPRYDQILQEDERGGVLVTDEKYLLVLQLQLRIIFDERVCQFLHCVFIDSVSRPKFWYYLSRP